MIEQSKNMNRQILDLAIPNIISNVSIPLLSVVDTVLMGNIGDPVYLGAIALGSAIFNMLYWGLGFLRMGTTGMTAQAFGRSDKLEMSNLLGQSFLLAMFISAVLILFQIPIGLGTLYLLNGSAEVQFLAREYFMIRIWAAPAALGLLVLNGWFLGMQNARYPLILTILVNLLNIVFNLYFIKYMGMTSDGIAWGTVLAQYITFVSGMLLCFYSYKDYVKSISKKMMFKISSLKRFFNLNRDIFLRTLCLVLVFNYFIAQSAQAGDLVLAANQILLQFLAILSYAVDGFAYATESLTGKFYGAKDNSNLQKSIKYCFIWGMSFAVLFMLVYGFQGENLLAVFTDNQEILELASTYLIWMVIMPIASSGAYIWDGIYIGALAGKPMRNSMIIATFLVFLPLYLLLKPYYGIHALWLSMMAFMIGRTITLWYLSGKYIKV